ncbi:MAG: hypothetical protein HC898_12405 [Phycisphaerales bacterium]|nr:hypothetical protein [Phycisphaerales bacterium]
MNPPEKSPIAIFGLVLEPEVYEPGYFERNFKQALADLDAGQPGRSIWWLYRHPEAAQQAVRERVTWENQMVSWLAAGILAMWDDPMAEPRLLRAIDDMEYGFDGDMAKVAGHLRSWEHPLPEKNLRLAPSWLVATGLLRCCGTARCLPTLEKLTMRDLPVIGVRATIAATLGRLIDKGRLTDADRLVPMLDRLLEGTLVDAQVPPQRKLGGMAQLAARGQLQEAQKTAGGNPHGFWMANLTGEDHGWQLHFTVATARAALGLPIQPQAQIYLSDPRKLVRDAFARVQARLGIKLQMPVREKVAIQNTNRSK